MAKGKLKKRLEFRDYDHAMERVEQLKTKGDTDSDEYEAAIEAATQFFLRDNDSYQFNNDDQIRVVADQNKYCRKWPTIKELAIKFVSKSRSK